MDTFIKCISALAPFLSPYPLWVKVLFASWMGLSALLTASLILAHPLTKADIKEPMPLQSTSSQMEAKSEIAHSTRDQEEVWLVIDGLEFFVARLGAEVRVRADINGIKFTYPSRGGVEWLEVGPSMSSQVFRLLPTRDRYIVRFEAVVCIPARDGSTERKGQLKSVREDIVKVADIPFKGRYVLHTFDPIHRARSAEANAKLIYRITNDPN